MQKSTKTGLLIAAPIVLGGAYLIFKELTKPKANDKTDVASPSKPETSGTKPTATSDFPLKKGSRGAMVKTLQSLLNSAGANLSPDSIFGVKTEAALKQIYGKTQIDSSADFQNLSNQLKNTSLKSSNLDWAWKLIDAYGQGRTFTTGIPQAQFSQLVVNSPLTLIGIKKNFQGIWKTNGNNVDMAAHNYSLNDYALRSAMNDGTLRIEITGGDLAGMYSTEPNIDLSKTLDIA